MTACTRKLVGLVPKSGVPDGVAQQGFSLMPHSYSLANPNIRFLIVCGEDTKQAVGISQANR